MATLTRNALKAKFKNGLIPTEKNFCDLIESMLNKCDDNFFGQWKPGTKYYVGDVVIHGNTLYRLIKADNEIKTDVTPKKAEKPLARQASEPPNPDDKGPAYCASIPPDCDTEHWAKLVFELKDLDWEYDNDELYAKTLSWKVGIGTDKPQAKLHVAEEQRGRMLFNPAEPLHHSHGSPQINPELRLERDIVPDCDLCYLSIELQEESVHIETSADKGYQIKHSAGPGAPATVLAVVTPNGTGIGTLAPSAALDVVSPNLGEWEVNPHDQPDLATVRLTNLKDGYCALQTVDETFNTFSTNAKQGFKFQSKASNQAKSRVNKVVVIDEYSRVGIGTDSPEAMLEVINPNCGKALISLENTNPAFSVVNLKPSGKTSYLTTGAENSFAVFKTDADCGFVFKRGGEYDPTGNTAPEKDLNGDPQVYIDQDGKLGIGNPPDRYELDLKGSSRSYETYLNTNETTIRELGKIDNALDTVCRLTPILFEWKTPDVNLRKSAQFGLRSGECDEFIPEVVKNLDKGNIAIAYQNIVPLLIKAIQEQQKMIEELIARK